MDMYVEMPESDKQLLLRAAGKQLWIRCYSRSGAGKPRGDCYLLPIRTELGDYEVCVAYCYPLEYFQNPLDNYMHYYYRFDLRCIDIIKPVEMLTTEELQDAIESNAFWEDET